MTSTDNHTNEDIQLPATAGTIPLEESKEITLSPLSPSVKTILGQRCFTKQPSASPAVSTPSHGRPHITNKALSEVPFLHLQPRPRTPRPPSSPLALPPPPSPLPPTLVKLKWVLQQDKRQPQPEDHTKTSITLPLPQPLPHRNTRTINCNHPIATNPVVIPGYTHLTRIAAIGGVHKSLMVSTRTSVPPVPTRRVALNLQLDRRTKRDSELGMNMRLNNPRDGVRKRRVAYEGDGFPAPKIRRDEYDATYDSDRTRVMRSELGSSGRNGRLVQPTPVRLVDSSVVSGFLGLDDGREIEEGEEEEKGESL